MAKLKFRALRGQGLEMIRRVCQWAFLPTACLLVGSGSLSRGQLLEQPKDKDVKSEDKAPTSEIKDEDLFKIDRIIDNYKKYAGRKNGVLLQAKAEVKKEGAVVLLIHWSIDYAGPRFPLHILEPSLNVGSYNQTYLLFFPVDDKGISHPVAIHPGVHDGPSMASKEAFLSVKRGEVARGTIELPLTTVKNAVRLKHPEVFSKFAPLQLYVQLRHTPYERGDTWGLDAWTGKLQSELLRIPLERSEKK